MDLPAYPARPAVAPPGLGDALGRDPDEVLAANYLMVVYSDEELVRSLRPDTAAMLEAGVDEVIVTAPGRHCDFVSRFFAPGYGIPEDPVTGSAHCALAPFWAERLGARRLEARQLSARGGELVCELRDDRVAIAGDAVLYLEGEIEIP
jgi:predicted PhzF superfamily epimerase YddE/YHI9